MIGILTFFDQMATNLDIPDYEYDEIAENNEEEKQNGAANRMTAYTGVLSAGFKDLLLKPQL